MTGAQALTDLDALIGPNDARESLVDAIAHRVVELLRDDAPLLDANAVARRAGLSREWVYDHKAELGAVPLGDGVKPRLGFKPAQVAEFLDARETSRRTVGEETQSQRRSSPRRNSKRQGDSDLLPIRGTKPQ